MCPNSDTLACRVVEAYLHVRLGIDASDGAHYDEAADHFAAAVKSCSFSSTLRTHYLYEDFVVLFGWDFESLWLTAHQKQCQVLLSAGRLDDALESLRHMMEIVDETTKVACLDWSTAFQQECSAAAEADRVLRMEIPGQDQHDGIHEAERDFFGEMYDHHQTSSPRHQQRPGRIKRLLAVARTPRAAPPPAPPTNPSSATAPATFKTRLRHLLTVQPVHAATPPVVDVPFAQGKERNAAAGAPRNSADGYVDWVSTHSQQQTPAGQNDTGQGEHGSGRCCCF
ncbi:hypothetical protein DFH29DRAFT_97735 [Suillus ampliporus]|nr:hypothetical protein DFH29DRAFT_97735 [Suillus ampliporus]